ncbi:hypothetical protein ACTD5D_03955 [Nocardia takedensis]|uniref:hypothetical protein n=1 Tax=Nocardia takedensis TaxID=259390 RepID=UPI00031AB322|nr:hypothetical protein [Nocardia takedensis]
MPLIVATGIVGLDPMGMNKSGDQAVPASSTDLKVINWTARSGYPNTVITNNELIANGGGAVVVRCGVSVTGTLFMTTRRFQLMHNDTAVKTVDTDQATVALSDTSLTLAFGDRLWLSMTQPATYSATIVGGVNTYVYYDLA